MPINTTPDNSISGDELHNQNCHEFLFNVWKAIESTSIKKSLSEQKNKLESYDPDYAYGDLYTTFLTDLEKDIDQIPEGEDKTILLNAIFLNHSNLLENTAKKVLTPILKESNKFTFSSFESAVTNHLNKHQKKKRNSCTPQEMGSIMGRAWSSIGEFSPMKKTSIPCVKKYNYQNEITLPIEIRMGTQAEYFLEGDTGDTIQLKSRMNSLFKAWIKAQQQKNNKEKITHVYFNLLGRDREGHEGDREKGLTIELEAFEKENPNIAVITLPADDGEMSKTAHQHHAENDDCSSMFNKMLNIASGKQKDGVCDFYISESVKAKLYTSRDSEEAKLKSLIKKSFKTILDIDDPENGKTKLSPAQLQAVYFHFIKYELTNFILEKLEPTSFNTSCKDGIDRGGVASLYYNLMKSIELGKPLTEEEFQRGLHAAPTMVKGRGINHQANLIWNAVHHYIQTNETKSPDWLIKWRANFAPANTQLFYIHQLTQYVDDRSKKCDSHYPLFSTPHSENVEISAATKLKTMIEKPEIKPVFTEHELSAIKNGDLGILACNMATHGINFMHIYLQQLEQYKKSRKETGTFHSFFGSITGLSKAVKLSAADKLIAFLRTKQPQSIQNIEWSALHDGKLGDIVKSMEKNGFDLSNCRKAQHTTPVPSMPPR